MENLTSTINTVCAQEEWPKHGNRDDTIEKVVDQIVGDETSTAQPTWLVKLATSTFDQMEKERRDDAM
jgi:hypothetical protein